MHNHLIAQFDESTDAFLNAVDLFSQEQFNLVPFAGSWTAGQVAEHIYKSESGMPAVWNGNKTVTERPADQYVPVLRSIFLDFSTKLQAPGFILPSADHKQKDELYGLLKKNRAAIRELAVAVDLNQTFSDFAFPRIGQLTGVELITFITVHSLRHANQLTKIYEHVR